MSTRKRYAGPQALAIAVAILAGSPPAEAHCDSMDGPVVAAARRALALGDVAPALAWVRPQDETEIRAAFDRTLAVRTMGGPAAELAELWLFETLVRVHRLGEGEPYTGLKPAGTRVPPGIAAAERALEIGSSDELLAWLSEGVEHAVEERFERVRALADHDPTDVEAGRRYVAAYAEFVHLAEDLHQRMEQAGHGNGAHMETAGAH